MEENKDPLAIEIAQSLVDLNINQDDFRLLPENEAAIVLGTIKSRFVIRQSARWWWEHFRFESADVRFRDDNAYTRLSTVIPPSLGRLWMVVEGWLGNSFLVYESAIDMIQKLLTDGYKFEYYIVPKDLSWLVCENHHGYLIAVGNIAIQGLKTVVLENSNDILDQRLD